MRSSIASRAVSIRIGTRLPARAQPPAHLQAVHVRQADVEHERVRQRASRPAVSAAPPFSADDGLVSRQRQRAAQRVAQGAVVVDDQDLHPSHCAFARAAFGDS